MAVTYCTIADVRAVTNNADLQDEEVVTDEQMTAKILSAEVYIDSIVKYWRKYDTAQDRKFPRYFDIDANGTAYVPDAIKEATIAQVEFAYENMPDMDHGISQDDKPSQISTSPRAKQLLSAGYIQKVGSMTIPSPEDIGIDSI